MSKILYKFGADHNEGGAEDKNLLGGKGANLAEMAKLGLPVPPGFTITTEMCAKYYSPNLNKAEFVSELRSVILPALKELEAHFGYMPLISVRSGAPVSMPGMMDTILNVGLTSKNLSEWADRIGERAAYDSYRRLIQMFSNVVWGLPMEQFEDALEEVKAALDVDSDADLTPAALQALIKKYVSIVEAASCPWPDTIEDQVIVAVLAVFKSWGNDRAITYRQLNGIPDSMGTAVNVQAMVFGNMNEESCSGVLFTRDPATGEPGMMGEFLPNAQGEDVVAGIRTPLELGKMGSWNEAAYSKLYSLAMQMEAHYRDMQDMEFTVQNGELFILQTRNGKRSAKAAIRIAMDLLEEGKIDKATALSRVSYKQFLLAQKPVIDPKFDKAPAGEGIAAGGGVVTGQAVFSSEAAELAGGNVILVAKETTPDDIGGMNASVGILTSTGGATSHAAVVARGMDKTCVVGCTDLKINGTSADLNGVSFEENDTISIDGSTGRVWVGKVPVLSATADPAFRAFQKLALSKKKFMQVMSVENMEPVCGYMVYLRSEATSVDPASLSEALHTLKSSFCNKVVLDLRGPGALREASDAAIWGLFGEEPSSLDVNGVNKVLEEHKDMLDMLTLILPESVVVDDQSLPVVSEISSVAELVDAAGPVVLGEELANAVGGKAALNKLVSMLLKGGAAFSKFELRPTKDQVLVDSLA